MIRFQRLAARPIVVVGVLLFWVFSGTAFGQDLPPGFKILSPSETVELEHHDRKRRLKRLARSRLVAKPIFHEYIVPANDLKLKALPVDIPLLRVVFDTRVFFDFDKDTIRPQALSVLNIVAASLQKEPPDVSLFVAGHTDATGDDTYNYRLGMRRARAVAEALANREVRQVRIFRVSFGEKVPVAPNDTDLGRARNRRVEFLFGAHSDAIAFWLSKQHTDVCEQDNTGCRFSVELVPPSRPSISPQEKKRLVETPTSRNEARLGEIRQNANPSDTTSSGTVTLQPKRYVIDLSKKRYTIPTPVR